LDPSSSLGGSSQVCVIIEERQKMRWLSKKLKQLVKDSGMSQVEFSKAIGVSRTTFTKWITNNQIPKGWQLLKICRVLDITPTDLVDGGENPTEEDIQLLLDILDIEIGKCTS